MDDIKKSSFIGIQADESTDVTFRSHLALAIQYISEGEVKSHFVRIIYLEAKFSNNSWLNMKVSDWEWTDYNCLSSGWCSDYAIRPKWSISESLRKRYLI